MLKIQIQRQGQGGGACIQLKRRDMDFVSTDSRFKIDGKARQAIRLFFLMVSYQKSERLGVNPPRYRKRARKAARNLKIGLKHPFPNRNGIGPRNPIQRSAHRLEGHIHRGRNLPAEIMEHVTGEMKGGRLPFKPDLPQASPLNTHDGVRAFQTRIPGEAVKEKAPVLEMHLAVGN